MKKKYLITVRGTQVVDGESDTEELTTVADYTERDGKKLIKYNEYVANEERADIVVTNLVKIEGDVVSLNKRIEGRTGQMLFERGTRHLCMYANEIGNLTIGIFTETIVDNLSSDGGTLEINYTIDFNGGFESENNIFITLTKTEE